MLLIELIYMIGIDLIFVAVLIVVMLPLGIYRQAAFAVMKRNFAGYFSNPTGYVFLCLFVLLTSFAAFWPHEFFSTNLANFDQLNKFLPYIMLVFIPAITMSIWAEERQQKTDELLLTLPAQDIDIVIGKYFAAVLVFTVSLVFSQLSNYAVLLAMTGGSLDTGLLFSTYLGYWFIGIAMLSLGMVASFLTNNLTVSFIFGVVLNAPLAFLSNADVIFSGNSIVSSLYEWSILQRFEPFGRGLISPSSIVFFLGIVVVGIYISLVLIGRRHWLGGRDGNSLLGHYIFRSGCMIVAVIAAVLVVQYSPLNRLRLDVSREKISTLSPNTIKLIDEVASAKPVDGDKPQQITIDAYVGSRVPTDFVQTRNDLVNLLREIKVRGKPRIVVNVHPPIEPYSSEAINAESRFGISPIKYVSQSRGTRREEEVILGCAFSSGRERVVIPFFAYGMPVEAEIVRAINKLAQPKRKKVGVVTTDLYVTGKLLRIQGRSIVKPRLKIFDEIEKQYDVEDIELNQPLDAWIENEDGSKSRRYDVLMVVQPSKLSPTEMKHLLAAMKEGQPTLIFEDPRVTNQNYPPLTFQQGDPRNPQIIELRVGTRYPRHIPREGSMEPAKIHDLWKELGIELDGIRVSDRDPHLPFIAWSKENPYLRDKRLDDPETVIVHDDRLDTSHKFNREHPATRGINELIFQYVGIIKEREKANLTFTPLVTTQNAGRINLNDFERYSRPQRTARERTMALRELDRRRGNPDRMAIVAAEIKENSSGSDSEGINCIYVADIDLLADMYVNLRNMPNQRGLEYHFENTHFVLNLIDSMTGDTDYIDIRNRKLRHATLRYVEETSRNAFANVDEWTQNFEKDYDRQISAAEDEAQKELMTIGNEVKSMSERKDAGEQIDTLVLEAKINQLRQKAGEEDQKIQKIREQLENQRKEQLRGIQLVAEKEILKIQQGYKLSAVIYPAIPPLLLGLFVFTRRRLRERAGISKARRLK